MKFVFFEVHDWEKAYLEKEIGQTEQNTFSFYLAKLQDTNREEWKDAQGLCTFIYSEVTREVIDAMPNLQFIVTRSTGYNHIDVAAAKERGITIFTVPTYGENTVAEHTFALILNLSRKVHKSYVRTLQGDFRIEDLRGFDLQGKTLGVIGGGHIGMHVVKIAKGFGMHVLVSAHHPDPFLSGVLHFNYAPIEDVIAKSDILSLHVPLTAQTTHLISHKEVAAMKEGVVLINTSRGEVIDSAALLEGLHSGKIAGAGLDVIEGEKLVLEETRLRKEHCEGTCDDERWHLLLKDNEILRNPNVVFTPHNAFNSQEALERILQTSAQNIRSLLLGDLKGVTQNIVQ